MVGNSIGGGMVETVEIMGIPYRLQGDKEVVIRDKAGKEYHMASVLPVQSNGKRKPQLFDTFTRWIAVSRERNQGLAETAIDYEEDASGWSRVVTAVVMAIVFSQLALSGRSGVIPFHEVVDAVGKLGESMPSKLKCTSCGGMCETPTGRQCRDEFEKWRKELSPLE